MYDYSSLDSSPHFFRRENTTRIFALFSFLISLATIPLTLVLIQQQQTTKQYAAEAPKSTLDFPIVSLTSPTQGAIVRGTTLLSATVTKPERVIKVEFYANNSKVCTLIKSPYTCSWTPHGSDKNIVITAKVYDLSGNVALDTVTTSLSR